MIGDVVYHLVLYVVWYIIRGMAHELMVYVLLLYRIMLHDVICG